MNPGFNPTEHIGKILIVVEKITVRDIESADNEDRWDSADTDAHLRWVSSPIYPVTPGTCFILVKAKLTKSWTSKGTWTLVGLIGKQLISFELWDHQVIEPWHMIWPLDWWNGELRFHKFS